MKSKEYKVYILRCKDNSLYTGIALDLLKRLEEHQERKGAKYTKVKSRHPLFMELAFIAQNRSEASKVEYYFKKLDKKKKEYYLFNPKIFVKNIKENLNITILESELSNVFSQK